MAIKNRVIPAVIEEDGARTYTSVLSKPDGSKAQCNMVADRIIPVIFVPGVMGTNLQTNKGASVWMLNNSGLVAKKWMFAGAEMRKSSLDPKVTEVTSVGDVPTGTAQDEAELRRRGWGEVALMSYGDWLVWLENALNDIHPATDYGRNGVRARLMKELVATAPGVALLTQEEWSLSCKYQFPVHAVGYNWLQSNADSAERLAEKINEFTAYYRDKFRYRCEKVIIVTHSMGGLVARHYSEVLEGGQRDKVLGIVHGVMPTTGAATAYKRVKAGTEGIAGYVLGPDAATMTPVFAQSPGPLQLLPSTQYGRHWLKIRDGEHLVSMPVTDDPYGEIYTQRGKWWGLCNENLINPLDEDKKFVEKDWTAYRDLIYEEVKKFHLAIANQFHPHTYAFYGNDAKYKAWGDVVWDRQLFGVIRRFGNPAAIDDMKEGNVLRDDGVGEQMLMQQTKGTSISTKYVLRAAGENGDGTVPVRSGYAFMQRMKACVAYQDVEHEGAYKKLPQQLFAVWAITKIAQNVIGTNLEYKDCRR